MSTPKPNPAHANAVQDNEHIIWKASLNGLAIEWTNKDLYLHLQQEKAKPIFSELTQHRVRRLREEETLPPNCDYLRDFRVLSVVGPLISFEDEWSIQCGRGPSSSSLRFTTIDVAQNLNLSLIEDSAALPDGLHNQVPSGMVRLTDYFAEREILKALLADRLIRDALGKSAAPTRLADLSSIIKDEFAIRVGDDFFSLPSDYLTRFAFNGVDQNMVNVIVPLSPTAGAAEALRAQLDLKLPVPARLREALQLAQDRKQGFLMKDAKTISRNQTTEFQVELNKSKN